MEVETLMMVDIDRKAPMGGSKCRKPGPFPLCLTFNCPPH